MKHFIFNLSLFMLSIATSFAQQMPQDNWRFDGIEFSGPDSNKVLRSIAIGGGGVYVGYGDPATSVVQFQSNGTYIRQFGTFTSILGIACDQLGNVFILDSGDSTVKEYSSVGIFVRQWGGPGSGDGQFGSFGNAASVAMISADKNSQIYVCDPGNSRVQVFDHNGNFLWKWGGAGSLPSQFNSGQPGSIAASPTGSIYVSGKKFDPNGTFIWASTDDPAYFSVLSVAPDGVVAWSRYNQLYLSDDSNQQVAARSDSATRGLAFSDTGDIYIILTNKVRILEREYSGVHNALVPSVIPQPVVVGLALRSAAAWLDIDYKVTDTDSPTVTTAALAFLNGNSTLADVVPMRTFVDSTAANIGANQATGVEKRITWDVVADWSSDFAEIKVDVLAKDNREPLGLHWITVPASGALPAIEVSRMPVSDSDLLNLWFWYLATNESGINLVSGKIRANSGLLNGQELARNSTTNAVGRAYLYEKLGVRAINSSEIARVNAGNYGFVSVNQNSIVREAVNLSSVLIAWGANSSGQASTSVGSNSGVALVAAGGSHSLFVKSDGTLWAMGGNNFGQLGDGSTTSRSSPVYIMNNVAQIAAGDSHSLFVKTDGTLWAMGMNYDGQLGDGSTTSRSSPVQIPGNVKQIAAGSYHSLFVKADDTLWAMGNNNRGQLGDGSTTSRSSPVYIMNNVAQIAAGGDHSLFIKTDGTLWAMGRNYDGQLGDGSTTSRSSPVQIPGNVKQIAAGRYHSLFIKTDGTLWAMGSNEEGQLGDGSSSDQYSPIQIMPDVAQIAAGSYHSLFIKTGGTLWAMGANEYGQLGDGSTTNRMNPVQVGSNSTKVAAGSYHSLAILALP